MTIRNQRLFLLKQPISSTLNRHLIDYPTPSNLCYCWGFGSLAEHIMRDVEGGWLLRYKHANGASIFWGATIITSLVSAIPVVGDTIVTWLWGGFFSSSSSHTLNQYGSNNPLGVHSEMDKIASYPYFYVNDLVCWVAFAIFFHLDFYAPNVLGHLDNYIPANPMSTPPYIYTRQIGGVAAIAPVFICLLALPIFKSMYVRSSSFLLIHQGIFWLLLEDCLLLGWIGWHPVKAPFVTTGQISPLVFFLFFP
ncbi:unnamed protein product [Withania somnifera]